LPTFSACFGEAFLPFKPQVYADLLAQKIEQHGTNVWLVNTGWTGGKYGFGKVTNFIMIENKHPSN
jgi:phosphoenolpyruvate carboxykinase (ATP)